MFKLSSSGVSANFRNENERVNINSKIEAFQQINGECSSFKELFENLLNVSLGIIDSIKTEELLPENVLVIGETKEDLEKFKEIVENYRDTANLSDSYSFENVICAAISQALTPEIVPVEKEVPANIPENAMIIEFSDEPTRPFARKLEILKLVQSNRQKRMQLSEPENLSVVVEKLVFSEGALYNHGGDVYTGF